MDVCTLTSEVSCIGQGRFPLFEGSEKAIKDTGVRKLIDLGCGSILYGASGESDRDRLLEVGLNEYVGVDLCWDEDFKGIHNSSQGNGDLNLEFYKREILEFLSKQPDNSAHVMMGGLEDEVIQGDTRAWSDEVFKQMQRVVPNGGVMCLQSYLFNHGPFREGSDFIKAIRPRMILPEEVILEKRYSDGRKEVLIDPKEIGLEPCEVTTEGRKGYRFRDSGLGVDWYIPLAKNDFSRSFFGEERFMFDYLDMPECHGGVFWLVNRKDDARREIENGE
jgi:hypothetical protein